jgi:hypothetical protein
VNSQNISYKWLEYLNISRSVCKLMQKLIFHFSYKFSLIDNDNAYYLLQFTYHQCCFGLHTNLQYSWSLYSSVRSCLDTKYTLFIEELLNYWLKWCLICYWDEPANFDYSPGENVWLLLDFEALILFLRFGFWDFWFGTNCKQKVY